MDRGISKWPCECRDENRRAEIGQPHTIEGSVNLEAKLSESGAKDNFPPDLRITIFENDFGVMGRALIVYILEFSVDGIFNHIVLRSVRKHK